MEKILIIISNIITNLVDNITILNEIEKYNDGKLPCVITDKIDKSKIDMKIKSHDYRNRLLNLRIAKRDLENKIKNDINGYNGIPEYPLEKYYENYGDNLKEIKEQSKKYMKDRSYIDVIADYIYGEYSDVYKKYPTLTYEECKKLYESIKEHDKYMIRKYKIIHYKRVFYNELMKEVNDINEGIIWMNHLMEKKEVGLDRLYEMYCAILPKGKIPAEKNQFNEIIYETDGNLTFERVSYIFRLLSKKIEKLVKSFNLSGDKEEPSKEIEDIIYRRLGILYGYKELSSHYIEELPEDKQKLIYKIIPVIDRMIWIYNNFLHYPVLTMITQNNNDLLHKRNETYSAKEIFEERKKLFSDLVEANNLLYFKKIYDDFQSGIMITNMMR